MARSVRTALVLLLLGACAGDGGREDAAGRQEDAATTTSAADTTTTTVPPETTTTTVTGPAATVAAAPGRPAAASCPAVPERVAPRPDRPRYDLDVDVRLAENAVVGTTKVRFTPDLDTDRLVFRLWANAPRLARAGGRIDVTSAPDGAAQPDATTLVIARPLRAGQATEAEVGWRITLPGPVNDRVSRRGETVRLGSFFPILAWEPGVGWATEPATSAYAESSLSTPADVNAAVRVPDGLGVLATGVQQPDGRWVATAVPDFAVSVGRFAVQTATAAAGGPEPVAVTVGTSGVSDGPATYLAKVVRSLEDFGRRYGPYPWPSFSLAITPDLSGGIEYPMHVMQGPGTIGRTTSHEVAHMWFYGLVGSNQGRDPWIDEGISSFAEARYEGTLGSMTTRSIPAAGKGRAGEPMSFWESRQSAYYRSVYVQGAQALAALGPPDLVDCALRQVVARLSHRVARPADVIAALSTVFPDAGAVLARYGIRSQ
jgi:hypothetical protein